MIYWRCSECVFIERTSSYVGDLVHGHWNIQYKFNARYALIACRSLGEARSMWKVRKGDRTALTKKRVRGWRKVKS